MQFLVPNDATESGDHQHDGAETEHEQSKQDHQEESGHSHEHE
ncbi:MAG: hypothetical protein RID53_29415 [Coleofasciculus sp. B1-GNL1-01]